MTATVPPWTFADVTGVPMAAAPWRTVKVTEPFSTVTNGLVTVADRETGCAALLNVAAAAVAAAVVTAEVTTRVWVASPLVR